IATLAAEITRAEEHDNPSVVKAVLSFYDGCMGAAEPLAAGVSAKREGEGSTPLVAKCLYFTRATAPANDGPRYHHIGVYAYRYAALERFVAL
ncbi:hypothetical protein ACO1MN_14515, partial [Staphylococcus aureus]